MCLSYGLYVFRILMPPEGSRTKTGTHHFWRVLIRDCERRNASCVNYSRSIRTFFLETNNTWAVKIGSVTWQAVLGRVMGEKGGK